MTVYQTPFLRGGEDHSINPSKEMKTLVGRHHRKRDESKAIPLTNQTRLFLAFEGGAKFLLLVSVWRIMWRGGDQRVILREIITDDGSGFLQDFPKGCTLDLLGGRCSDKSYRHQGIWLYRFADCKVNRSWIPNAGVLHPHEMAALHYWLEIDCDILTTMEDLSRGKSGNF